MNAASRGGGASAVRTRRTPVLLGLTSRMKEDLETIGREKSRRTFAEPAGLWPDGGARFSLANRSSAPSSACSPILETTSSGSTDFGC